MASTQQQMQAARETRTDADPDSGAVGDLHAADCRAELRRMADALGTRARYGYWERLLRARRRARAGRDRRPQRAESRADTAGIARGRRADCESDIAQCCRAACGLAVSGAGRAEWAQRYPRYPQAVSGALRALQWGKSVLIGPKRGQMRRIQAYRHGAALGAFGGMSGDDRVSPIL